MDKDQSVVLVLSVVSDGKANAGMSGRKPLDEEKDVVARIGDEGIRSLVIVMRYLA